MTVHAFVDESRRGSTYILAAAIAEPVNLRLLRRDLRGLLLPGQREIHFKREKEPRQRQLATAIARLPIRVRLYVHGCVRQEEAARQACVDRVACDLLDRGAHRLVLDSRDELDAKDEATIRSVGVRHPNGDHFAYEHVDSTNEALLWVADTTAWCFGAGNHWRRLIDPLIEAVINLEAPSIARSPA
ncbi:MAG TPA: DUF3800 domain-containing protein [Actinophytocola sp.]|jgi:hypothetical protein|uniref:DUF3800 domain-containing protein n=1 Tax=Actinophytocola sp. TaxID=1872138 RepID=UPI002E0B0DF4|nr:DUF3800 domain-containing protein [Actinophytocola sp.]